MSVADYLEPLNPIIVDHNTVVRNHNVYTHLGCVLLRCMIGAAIISSNNGSNDVGMGWVIFCIIVAIIFASKYISYSSKNTVVWKTYLRTVISYSLAGAGIYNGYNKQAGLLVIVDALMGLQSRHMAFVASHIVKNSK